MGLYESFLRTLVLPVWYWKDGIYPYEYLRESKRTQFLSEEELRDLQLSKLKRLLNLAYEKCPYYRNKWKEHGVHPDAIKNFDDFRSIPMTSKGDLQQNVDGMCNTGFAKDELVRNMTGGSTGQPVIFYHDPELMKIRLASTMRHDEWAGKLPGDWFASVWGHHRDLAKPLNELWYKIRRRLIYRDVVLDTSKITNESLNSFVEQVRRYKPKSYVTYANSIHLLGRWLESRGITDFPKPRGIITTAEFLEPSRREYIERILGAPVFDRYGSRETSVLASECEYHDGLHVNMEHLYIELLKPDGTPAGPGEKGEVVVTDLSNIGMPLIRYRLRDVAEPVAGTCRCGRGLSRIKMVGGRVTDFILTPSRKLVSGASMTIFLTANTPGVGKMQLYQEKINTLEIRIVAGDKFTDESREYCLRSARKLIGEDLDIFITLVDDIPVPESGKMRYSISEVDPFEIDS